jgi:hypothetical protein
MPLQEGYDEGKHLSGRKKEENTVLLAPEGT